MYIDIYSLSKIVGLASQLAIQNCLGCYSKFSWLLLKIKFR